MAGILRGEVYWSDARPTRGRGPVQRRPLLVLSRAAYNERSGTVIAAAITSQPQRAGFPLTLKNSFVPLPKEAWIKIAQLRTVSVERLGERIGRLPPAALARVVAGLDEIIGAGD
jgi:mRNA interferase MazF